MDSDGEAEGEPDSEAEGEADGVFDGEPDSEAEGEAEGVPDGEAEGVALGVAEGEAEGEADSDGAPVSDGDADTEAEGEAEIEAEGVPDGDGEGDDTCFGTRCIYSASPGRENNSIFCGRFGSSSHKKFLVICAFAFVLRPCQLPPRIGILIFPEPLAQGFSPLRAFGLNGPSGNQAFW